MYVEEAVSQVKNAMLRLDQVYAEYAAPDADFDALAKEQGELEAIQRFKDLCCDGYVLNSRYLSDDDLRELASASDFGTTLVDRANPSRRVKFQGFRSTKHFRKTYFF